MKTLLVLLSSIGLSSCMHLGMMGSGDNHHSGGAQENMVEPDKEKIVTVGDVRAIALFPALKFGGEVTLSLRLTDAGTGVPISGAKVYLHAQYAHRVTPSDDLAESSLYEKEREHDIDIGQEVAESTTPGVYAIPYGSSQTGEHILMFHISAIGDRTLAPEITVEATRTISGERHDYQSGRMGGASTTTYVIIGAAVMGIVMIAIMAGRAGMF